MVFDQPYLGLLPEPFFPRQLPAVDAANENENPFAGLDLVIIGDVSPGRLPERVWEQLERFVAEDGSTLVLTAGQRYFPQRHRSKTLAELLPIEDPHEFSATADQAVGPPSERGIRLSPTPDGRQQLMLQFSADPAENIHIWQQLPGILRGQAGRAKPAGTVFLSLAAQDGRPTTLEQDRQNAVMAHQYFGFGQVVWLAIDSTWRWRNRVGDEYHHRFWGQLARWAWQNRAMAGNDYVKLSLDRSNIEVGENVLIRSRWTTSARERLWALTDRVVIYRVLPSGQRREYQTLNLQSSE